MKAAILWSLQWFKGKKLQATVLALKNKHGFRLSGVNISIQPIDWGFLGKFEIVLLSLE